MAAPVSSRLAFLALSDPHELLFLGGEFLFGDDAGIQKILVLLDLSDSIGGGGGRGSSGGSLTGYAGGLDKKIRLLELEKADMSRLFRSKKGTAL